MILIPIFCLVYVLKTHRYDNLFYLFYEGKV